MAAAVSIPGIDALRERDTRWYLPEYEDDRARKLSTVASALWENDYARRENYLRYWSLYSNLPLLGLSPRRYTQRNVSSARTILSLNVVSSCSDAFVARLTNQQPRVSYTTTGGDWDMQERAKSLETFTDGQFYETDLYQTAPQVALDCAIFGTGTLKIYADDDGENEHITLERILPWETFVDDEEAYGGRPRCRYQRRYVDRLVAMAEFPDVAEQLAMVSREAGDNDEYEQDNQYTDTILLIEGWHLPSRAGAGDGRHTIVCGQDLVVFDEPWDKAYFPFVDLYRQKPQCGIWGRGLGEELQGIQFELNTITNMIRQAIRMSGTVRWLVPNGSNVNTQYISDLIGSIIRFDGAPPEPITPPAVSAEVYSERDRLVQRAYEMTGISQMSAASQAPATLTSGKALETYTNIESERFSVAFRQYQHFFLQVGRQIISLAREIGQRNPAYKVKAVGKGKMMEVVRWADIHLEEDEYIVRPHPTNAFAQDPAARLQQVLDLMNSGTLDPKTGRRLLDGIPDLEEEDSYEYASYNLTMQMVDAILKEGDFNPPEPFMDLQDSIKRFQFAYLKARQSNVPEERLDLMRRWIEMAHQMMAPPPPPPGPPPANTNGPPPGAPAGPPPPGAPPSNGPPQAA